MPISEDNQAIVDAIDRRVGNFNVVYTLLGATILIMLLLSLIGYFSISKTNRILEEFVEEVKLNTKDRTANALLMQSVNGLTLQVSKLDAKLGTFMDNQTAFNNKHTVLLDDAKTYINQNPIELLRKGK